MSIKKWGGDAKKQSEKALHAAVARYLRLRHPGVLFFTDSGSGAYFKGEHGAAVKARHTALNSTNESGAPDRCPDLFVAAPRGKYAGLYVELKREGTRIYKRDGSFANEHLKEQAATIARLERVGYFAQFAVGLDAALEAIDSYLNIKKSE